MSCPRCRAVIQILDPLLELPSTGSVDFLSSNGLNFNPADLLLA